MGWGRTGFVCLLCFISTGQFGPTHPNSSAAPSQQSATPTPAAPTSVGVSSTDGAPSGGANLDWRQASSILGMCLV